MDLQTTYSGKNISILMGKLREKWVEIIKNSGKMMLKILYEPCMDRMISEREYSAFQVDVINELKLLALDEKDKSLKSRENYICLLYL